MTLADTFATIRRRPWNAPGDQPDPARLPPRRAGGGAAAPGRDQAWQLANPAGMASLEDRWTRR